MKKDETEGTPNPEYNHPGWSYKLRMQCSGVVSRYTTEEGLPQRTKCERVEWLTIHPLGEVPMGKAIQECSTKLRSDLGWAQRKDITRLTPKGRYKRVWLCPTCLERTENMRTRAKVELKELKERHKEELAAKESELQAQLELLRAKQNAALDKATGKKN
jgi:hypothetical protein